MVVALGMPGPGFVLGFPAAPFWTVRVCPTIRNLVRAGAGAGA